VRWWSHFLNLLGIATGMSDVASGPRKRARALG
jgi:hypothetical protein